MEEETVVTGRSISGCFLLLLLLLAASSGCNSPELEKYVRPPVASKVTLTGSFMTESPDEILFPRKILFAIDSSLSMGDTELGYEVGSDPNYLRIEAVRNFIDKYNSNDNVSFEVMLWSSSVFNATRTINGARGFTKDPDELNRVLDGASVDTTTDYLGTLNSIYRDIRSDIVSSSSENLTRTKYIVVFLSDGMSNAGGGKTQSTKAIYDSVSAITSMVDENGVGGFNFHTSLLLGMFGPGQDGSRTIAENVLQGMAERGKGQFTLFENAESIDFVNVVDMRLTVEYQIKYLLAFNHNVRAGEETLYVDSDGDGLSDVDETDIYGTDPLQGDTDGDGLSDFFEISLSGPGGGLDPLLKDSPCDAMPDNVYPDTDGDWMNDCEEDFKGTNRRVADTDHDGIPDGLEFLAGTNPLENQLTKDSDFDGVLDWIEVQQHTNVIANDPDVRRKYAYSYDIKDAGLEPMDQGNTLDKSYVRRYDFTISNIDILNTGLRHLPDGRVLAAGENVIRFYIAQVPEDTPDVPPVFRMKEVVVRFADVLNSKIVLTPGDFSLLQ